MTRSSKSPQLLDAMGVDIIEAGFPAASERRFRSRRGNREARQERGRERPGARQYEGHRPRGEAIRHAKRGRIHTFIATSPIHMQFKLQMSAEQVFDIVVASVTRAR